MITEVNMETHVPNFWDSLGWTLVAKGSQAFVAGEKKMLQACKEALTSRHAIDGSLGEERRRVYILLDGEQMALV